MDQGNNVHLMWNKHQDTMVSMFDALLDSDKLTDCTISVEGKCLRAHKIILSACSPHFEELFTVNYEKHPIIILHDVKYGVVKALIDYMYRGEVNVPQCELSGLLKLSESLKIRGLSGSKCVDDVDVQKGSERNEPPVCPQALQSEPASLPSFTSNRKVPEENVQSFRGCSPTVSFQLGCGMEVYSIPKSIQKFGKSIKCSAYDQRKGPNAFRDNITPDLDSEHELPPQRKDLLTTCNSTGGPVFSPIACQSVNNELKSPSKEMTVVGKVQFLMPEEVLDDKMSANLNTHRQEVSVETKSEVLETRMEIVKDLTLDDDDDYRGDNDYRGDRNTARDDPGEGVRESEGLTYEENVHTQDSNSVNYQSANEYSDYRRMTTSKRFGCSSCGKSYQYLGGLQRHTTFECGKEPQFQCPRCNKRCHRNDALKQHMTSRRCLMRKK